MEDVQSHPDGRQIPIDQVGVSDLRYPIVVLDRELGKQQTVARLTIGQRDLFRH
jgi:GTP cyclohydrolase IB